ncbi:hypothetical protein MTR_6g081890 [Medicago truncatula]|uniref:Uncharacterized protein n=1 Tax=Medicago truncatula TaxID=3880 RepID=G7KM54_MEDTR|nr:hypothetical protein MTR_6g081890 [Medicago truncatula]
MKRTHIEFFLRSPRSCGSSDDGYLIYQIILREISNSNQINEVPNFNRIESHVLGRDLFDCHGARATTSGGRNQPPYMLQKAVTEEYLHEGQRESSRQNVKPSQNQNINMLKKVEEVDKGKVSISLADLDLEELLKVKASLKVLQSDIEALKKVEDISPADLDLEELLK